MEEFQYACLTLLEFNQNTFRVEVFLDALRFVSSTYPLA